MGDVVPLVREYRGNGAREALTDIVGPHDKVVDGLLADLWLRGFKIVPLEDTDHELQCG